MAKDDIIARQRSRCSTYAFAAGSALILLLAFSTASEKAWALPNPASVFCVKSGGKSEMRKGPRGVYGVCRLPNGRVVDEWAYFHGMRAKARSSR